MFPVLDLEKTQWCGMTLRDYFAAAAIQSVSCGIIATANTGTTEESLAATAYSMADAMLKERDRR